MSTIQEFDFSVNLLRAILWQYNEALRLQGLLEEKQAWYNENQTAFWEEWYRDIFDLRTANEFGLSVWSIILNQPLVVDIGAPDPDKPTFGFEEYRMNFENGNFTGREGAYVNLTLEQKRIVLRLRYYQLISKGTVPEANFFAREIFGAGVYVLDGLDMSATYVFPIVPTAALAFILKYFDILPRPAGVLVNYLVLPVNPFGFEQFRVNFDNGQFAL